MTEYSDISCIYCNTRTIIEIKDYSFWEDGKKHIISDVKHFVCPECGEEYYDEEASQYIDDELEKIRGK